MTYKCKLFSLLFFIALSFLSMKAFPVEKAVIAVIPFDNKSGLNPMISDTLSDMLVNALANTNKFQVSHRNDLKKIADEQQLGASGQVEEGSRAEMGKVKGAAFTVIGTVIEASANTKITGVYDVQVTKSTVTLAANVRFVDAETGIIRRSELFRISRQGVSVATDSSGSIDISQGVGTEMAQELVESIAKKLVITVYPPKILRGATDEGGEVVLNCGEGIVKIGEHYEVNELGEDLIDPDTKEKLGQDEKRMGEIEIVSVDQKTSKGTVIAGTAPTGSVCRNREIEKRKAQKPVKEKKVDPF